MPPEGRCERFVQLPGMHNMLAASLGERWVVVAVSLVMTCVGACIVSVMMNTLHRQ